MPDWQTAKMLALSLPEAEERDHFGSPSFRVRGKIFAQLSAEPEPLRRAILKLALADQDALILSDAQVFSSVPQWGRHGWTYVQLDQIEAALFRDLLWHAWRQVAPKRLRAAHAAAHHAICDES